MGAGLLAVGSVVGGGFMAIRGDWTIAAGLVALGAVLAVAARSRRGPYRVKSSSGLAKQPSEREARALLGVSAAAGVAEIRAAYARLMRVAHPDRGGTSGLAAQLNAARDRLLKGG
jgi:hypothetical protein